MPRTTAVRGHRDGCSYHLHDTPSAYRNGCRCTTGRESARIYHKRRREHRLQPALIDATGTVRRIKALNAIGWRLKDIAPLYGAGAASLDLVRRAEQVHRVTAERIAAVYEQLRATSGPSVLVQARAKARGWLPPSAWGDGDDIDDPAADPTAPTDPTHVDEVLIERAIKGDRDAVAQLSPAERAALVDRGEETGVSRSRIARILGASYATVQARATTHQVAA